MFGNQVIRLTKELPKAYKAYQNGDSSYRYVLCEDKSNLIALEVSYYNEKNYLFLKKYFKPSPEAANNATFLAASAVEREQDLQKKVKDRELPAKVQVLGELESEEQVPEELGSMERGLEEQGLDLELRGVDQALVAKVLAPAEVMLELDPVYRVKERSAPEQVKMEPEKMEMENAEPVEVALRSKQLKKQKEQEQVWHFQR